MSDESMAGGDFVSKQEAARERSFAEWCMVLAIGAPIAWKNRPAALRSFESAGKFTVNFFIVVVGILLILVIYRATMEKLTIIEPISLPKAMEERGFTGTVVAQRLIDQVHAIGAAATTHKERVRFDSSSQFAALSAVQVPSSGLTVQSMVSVLRDLVGAEDSRIGGEITVVRPATAYLPARYSLLLRFDRPAGRTTNVVESDNVDDLISLSARAIVYEHDPYVLASYLYQKEAWTDMDRVIDRLIGSPDPDVAKWAFLLRGLDMKRQRKNGDAIKYYNRALALDPGFALAHNNLGALFMNNGDRVNAIKHFDRAIELNPKLALAWANLGVVLNLKGEFEAAKALFETALKINPKAADVYYKWGWALAGESDYDGAIEKYRRATEVDLKAVDAYHDWAQILIEQKKDRDGAIETYSRAIRLNPKYETAYWELGWLLKDKQQYDQSIESFRQVVTLAPEKSSEIADIVSALATFRDRGNVP
jgi:tetratricopeptide (TPR) repeat protein